MPGHEGVAQPVQLPDVAIDRKVPQNRGVGELAVPGHHRANRIGQRPLDLRRHGNHAVSDPVPVLLQSLFEVRHRSIPGAGRGSGTTAHRANRRVTLVLDDALPGV